jgi:hypothetical protein
MNLLSLLGSLPQLLADIYKQRQEIKAKEREREFELQEAIHKRRVELIAQGLAADANWEMEFARQAATSWKDEYTLIVISIPALLCFIPGMDTYVKAGFSALNETPAWYQITFLSLFLATVGIRYWRRTQSDT